MDIIYNKITKGDDYMNMIYLNKDFIGDKSGIYIFFCLAHQEKNMHSHEFWELTYVYEGEGINYVNGDAYPVGNGELILVKPGTEHRFVLPQNGQIGDVKMLNCLFTEDYLAQLLTNHSEINELSKHSLYKMMFDNKQFCIHLSNDRVKNVKKLLWIAEYEYSHFADGSQAVIDNSISSLLITIIRLYEYSIQKSSPSNLRNVEMERLIKYINSNFGQKLSLALLADYVHLSREYLSRYFKQYTGKNISDYLLDIRIVHAQELLAISEYSIEDICTYCGYSTMSNFQRTFKKLTGVSPSQYRKIIQNRK